MFNHLEDHYVAASKAPDFVPPDDAGIVGVLQIATHQGLFLLCPDEFCRRNRKLVDEFCAEWQLVRAERMPFAF